MSYYQLNGDKLLEKAKNTFHCEGRKKKATKYLEDNQEVLREKARNQYRHLSEQEMEVKEQCRK